MGAVFLTMPARIALASGANFNDTTVTPAVSVSPVFSGNVGIGTSALQTAFAVTDGNVGIGTWTAAGGNLIVNGGGNVGIGSAWPGKALDVQGTVRSEGDFISAEYHPTFSTSQTIDWSKGNDQEVDDTSTSAVTVTMSNGLPGQDLRLVWCNDGVIAGTVTFSSVKFSGGTQPGNTTTSGECDVWYFTVTVPAGGSVEYWLTGQTTGITY